MPSVKANDDSCREMVSGTSLITMSGIEGPHLGWLGEGVDLNDAITRQRAYAHGAEQRAANPIPRTVPQIEIC